MTEDRESKFYADREEFIRQGGKITHHWPILDDFGESAGSAKGHYFHQDLLVASLIFKNKPQRHIDVGSRVDGFVAHVAAFRQIEVIDVRTLHNTGHENIVFREADMMNPDSVPAEITDSVSCLHALEHFGLGRYGDPVDINGNKKGFENLLRMLVPGGYLYVSFPIGLQNEVHFNAHRVFHPHDVLTWTGTGAISLVRFDYVDDAGDLHQFVDLLNANIRVHHGCGIYTFRKNS